MTDRSFLLLHGWQNRRPAAHWQHWLADALTDDGHQVLYPQLPEPDAPVLADWQSDLRRYLRAMRGDERVLLCHSLSTLLWWTAAADLGDLMPDRVLLVAPPCPDAGVPEIEGFFPVPRTPAVAEGARLVHSDGDPYCAMGAAAYYGALGVPADVVPGGGHLNPDAGLGPWPAVLAWCQGAKNGVET